MSQSMEPKTQWALPILDRTSWPHMGPGSLGLVTAANHCEDWPPVQCSSWPHSTHPRASRSFPGWRARFTESDCMSALSWLMCDSPVEASSCGKVKKLPSSWF